MNARVLAPALAIALGACAAVTGLGDYEIEPNTAIEAGSADAPAARNDADLPAPGDPLRDSGPDRIDVDAGPIVVDDSTCAPNAPLAVSNAYHVAPNAIAIDGKTTEWPCAWRSHLDATNAQQKALDPTMSADFATAWSDAGVYFMARAHYVGALATTNTANPFRNDAVELYFSATPPAATGVQGTGDLHLAIDYENRRAYYPDYTTGPRDPAVLSIQSATAPIADGFALEVFIPRGATTLAENQVLYFDVQQDGHQTGNARPILWLYLADPGAAKGACSDALVEPACNTRVWGNLKLLP